MKGLLRWIARRCEIHDRAWPSVIRSLEADLDMEPTVTSASLAEFYCNPNLIGCGHEWCRKRREPRRHGIGGHASTDATIRDLPPLPPALVQQPAPE